MSQVIEVPGVGNVEFPDEMSNDDISNAIKNHIIPQHQQQQLEPGEATDIAMGAAIPAAATAAPAVAKAIASAPEAYQTAKTIATPAAQGAWNLAKTYASNPKTLAVDLGAGHFGLPPPTASKTAYEGIGNTYQAVQDWLNKTGQFAPQNTPSTTPNPVDVANEAKRNAVVNAVHDHISANPGAMQDFAPHLGDTEKMAQIATQKGIPIPGVNNIPSTGPATTQTVGTADNFMSRMASLADKYGKPVTNALSSIAESPVGRAVGTAARIAGSVPAVGAQLMLHSSDLNAGEDEEVKLMHDKWNLEHQQLANKHATEMNKYIQARQKLGSQ